MRASLKPHTRKEIHVPEVLEISCEVEEVEFQKRLVELLTQHFNWSGRQMRETSNGRQFRLTEWNVGKSSCRELRDYLSVHAST